MTFFREKVDARRATDLQNATVLTKSTIRAADELGVSQKALAEILGVSQSTVSRMRKGSLTPERGRGKTFELEALFVRCFVSLQTAVQGDGVAARAWLMNYNLALREKPAELLKTVRGLVAVVQYLDSRTHRL